MIALLNRFIAAARRLRSNASGNVLMIFAFSLIPLTFATGMTIDYARAARLQTRLNALIDAGALAGVSKPMMTLPRWNSIIAAYNTFYAQAGVAQCQGTVNRVIFKGCSWSSNNGANVYTFSDGTLSIVVTDSTTGPFTRTIQLSYSAASGNIFGNLFGMSSIPIGSTTTTKAGTNSYFQIVFAVDISNSMGIGGTAADITNLSSDKTINCAFACHDPNGTKAVAASNYCDAVPSDYFCHSYGPMYCPYGNGNCLTVNPSRTYSDRRALAKRYGYKLKIDYVNDAIASFMSSLQSPMQNTPNNYLLSIYTFGTDQTQLLAPTTDWATANTAAGTVDIETAKISPSTYWGGGGNQGWTFTTKGLQYTLSKIANIGDGSSPTSRKTYVIFLSDGVEDDYGPIINGRSTYYNYAAQCQAIKNAGITMFSIEAAYPVVTPDLDGQYNALITQLPSRNNGTQIADVMKGCASSPDKYYFANDGPGITAAANNVFASIMGQAARLTN